MRPTPTKFCSTASVLLVPTALFAGALAASPPSRGDMAGCLTDRFGLAADLFVASSTADITNPGDSCLPDPLADFQRQVDEDIQRRGADPTGSTLVEGAFWSDRDHELTYEESLDFHVCAADELQLHDLAEMVRRQFHQQEVLTFEYLPPEAPGADSEILEIHNVDIKRFSAVFNADPVARAHLGGGSITLDHVLLLVALRADDHLARGVAGESSQGKPQITVLYGKRQLVGD
jgi:hypothetical protein